jgi:hypothetical protein
MSPGRLVKLSGEVFAIDLTIEAFVGWVDVKRPGFNKVDAHRKKHCARADYIRKLSRAFRSGRRFKMLVVHAVFHGQRDDRPWKDWFKHWVRNFKNVAARAGWGGKG